MKAIDFMPGMTIPLGKDQSTTATNQPQSYFKGVDSIIT